MNDIKDVITSDHIKAIKRWLKYDDLGKELRCPFIHSPGCELCRTLFPLIPIEESKKHCPCHFYPISHVTKIARQVVRRFRKEERK